ncbi:polysaccharide deacetylase family protein [Paenalcaligenes niemegkensis]|uniref:polysaccharide deacetylase family protein n=1 Tax=Paenalcaligenes niemegkensis TaxID=2895469 RepID=UPI0027E3B175|nr:polysaccharide deacetylase family protein [Paenalcaligenes niemegkensis]MCQ9616444.1 polysaccharide deacetylase family protein [Paenalcaligenes niemegkensis]
MFTFLHSFFKLLVTSFVLLMLACSHYAEPFVAPENRERHANQRPWVQNSFLVLAWHDVEDSDPSQKYLSVSTAHLQQQFSWLKTSGYTPVSVDQILEARAGGPPLPDRAVVLTFDDGYSSFYDRVYPLLMAYQWPAILAPVGTWVDAPDGGTVDFGGEPVARERFLHWDQIEEMAASGLVEIGAHTYNLHYGLPANPQGNVQPAAASRRYDPKTKQYESQESFTARVADDVKKSLKKSPRLQASHHGSGYGHTAVPMA